MYHHIPIPSEVMSCNVLYLKSPTSYYKRNKCHEGKFVCVLSSQGNIFNIKCQSFKPHYCALFQKEIIKIFHMSKSQGKTVQDRPALYKPLLRVTLKQINETSEKMFYKDWMENMKKCWWLYRGLWKPDWRDALWVHHKNSNR